MSVYSDSTSFPALRNPASEIGGRPPPYYGTVPVQGAGCRVYRIPNYEQTGQHQPLIPPRRLPQSVNPPQYSHYNPAPTAHIYTPSPPRAIGSNSEEVQMSPCGIILIVLIAFCGGAFIIGLVQIAISPPGPLPPNEAFWGELVPAPHCFAYGKREYSAQLLNMPERWNPSAACYNTSIEIRGTTFRSPDRCEHRIDGEFGHWIMDQGEMNCMPIFAHFRDVGCVGQGSGLRRIEAQIRDIQRGDDWKVMCATTPVTYRDVYYPGPTQCEDRRWHRKVAIWDIEDSDC